MANGDKMISLQLELFLLILVGYILSKNGMFSASTRKQLTSIVLTIVLPCATIESFMMDIDTEQLFAMAVVLIISTAIQFYYWFFCKTCWNNQNEDHKVNLQYGTMVSNAGFMGMPVSQSVFGSMGLLYASIFLIPQRICMWSYGLSLYTQGTSKREIIKKVATNPCIVAIYIGLFLMLLGTLEIELPTFLTETISVIGDCNTALSMIVIGGILSEVDKEEIKDKICWAYSFLRLLVLPIGIACILHFIPVDEVVKDVCILLSAMPAASTTAMLAQSYDRDPAFASKLVFASTLLSMVTLPFILTFICWF